jgi:ubiquinone/menaquinone biosynthesis C-methylase UbiE
MDNVRRIEFETASAFDLPAADRSIDVVFTFAALEQMELGLDKALSEIRRVAGRYVLLYEPFADANKSLERAYLWSRNYFRMSSERLRDHGLEPVKIWKGFPLKPTFGYALLLCRPIPVPT